MSIDSLQKPCYFMHMDIPPYLTISSAAEYLGITRQSVLAWVDDGKVDGAFKGPGQTSAWMIPTSFVANHPYYLARVENREIKDVLKGYRH